MPWRPWIPWLFLAVSLWGAWFTYNGLRPTYRGERRAVLSFFAGWLTTELAAHHVAWQLLFTLGFLRAGALDAWPGRLGLAITLVSWAGLLRIWRTARRAEAAVETALRAGLGERYAEEIPGGLRPPAVDWKQLLLPVPVRHPEVERVRDLVYHREGAHALHLDVYRRRDHPTGCPTLLQIHGGAWMVGSKNEQGLPLMVELAARGWVCVSANYRLAPRATFPDPVIDLKRAIAWIRRHGPEHGADPDFLVVTGGSAGGHLAALVALTPNDPAYQPGFADVDTAVDGCVAFYGVYDFTDAEHNWPHGGLQTLLERRVMKTELADARAAWERASPIHHVGPGAPPFFVIHGDRDTMVPVAEARRFVAALRAGSREPVIYAEIPGAQHAFEILPSLRTTFVVHGVERFLAWLHGRRAAAGARAAMGR